MPPFRKPSLVTLRRQDLSIPWGFRLIGGVNHGQQPFVVQKVTPESIADKSGLTEGDELIRIGNITLRGLTHEEVQEIILRCRNVIDLFVIREDEENSETQTKEQENLVNNLYNSPINPYSTAKSLTEPVQVETEYAYYTNSIDYNSPTSPPLKQIYAKEQETYQYSGYNSPSLSKRPQSPLQKPPLSGRPFSPPMNRPFSPTNPSSSAISYHQAEEQQWLSTDQQRDARVFGSKPSASPSTPSPVPDYQRRNEQQFPSSLIQKQRDDRIFGLSPRRSASPSPSPIRDYQQRKDQQWPPPVEQRQRDDRIFGQSPRRSASPSPSPVPNYKEQQRNAVHWSPNSEIKQIDNRVFGAKPRAPANPSYLNESLYSDRGPKKPLNRSQSTENPSNYSYDNQQNRKTFAENKRPETFKNLGYERPQVGRVINDRRNFGNKNKLLSGKLGGSFDETPHWKEPLPQLKTAAIDQLLPSQTKQQQTYIVQTPPTERNARPPLTGSLRRRIRPVWPPPDHNGRIVPKGGFSPGGRDSPNKVYNWPPNRSQSFDDGNGNYYEDGMSPNQMGSHNRLKYANPPPGALQQAWNPRSGSATPPGMRSYRPSQRVRNTNWPPTSNATPAGFKPQTSLPGSRRSSQVDDYITYGVNNRIPQTYRPPPGTQYFQQSYHYDTD